MHLLSDKGGLLDSFTTVHPTKVDFCWTKLIKCKYTGMHQGLEAPNGANLDLIMTFLPTPDWA